MEDIIKKLRTEAKFHRDEAGKRQKAIEGLQAVCEHEWRPASHDSHHNYRECKICGKNERC